MVGLYIKIARFLHNYIKGIHMFTTENAYRGGRPKGSKNKITIDVRDQVFRAFAGMDPAGKKSGFQVFQEWARKNRKSFYLGIFAKLAEKQIDIVDKRQQESFVEDMARRILVEKEPLKAIEAIEAKAIIADFTPIVESEPAAMPQDIKPKTTPKSKGKKPNVT